MLTKIGQDEKIHSSSLITKTRSGSGHEKDTFELSCQNRDLQERVVHERYKDAAIGEELECQHERGNAAALKIFHVFNFGCSCAPPKIPISTVGMLHSVLDCFTQISRTYCELHLLSFDYKLVNIPGESWWQRNRSQLRFILQRLYWSFVTPFKLLTFFKEQLFLQLWLEKQLGIQQQAYW